MAHYSIQKKLYESSNRVIFKAVDESSGRPVILKTQKPEFSSEKDFAGLQHEYEIINALSGIEGVIKAYEVTWQDGVPAIAVEETEGISLAELIRSEKILDVSLFLELSCKLAAVLGNIHKAGILHKDIKPSNILVSSDKKQVYFIDFHLSSVFLKETSQNVAPGRIEGTLLYISPEQTGRVNRSTDYRSDFYSLGITFYQMLTGRVPFESEDPLELVYCHIARSPLSPYQLNSRIPEMLSRIILKLLSKTAEERYQSAAGLEADLTACLASLNSTGKIVSFEPGLKDRPISLMIPEKLYGREHEIKILSTEYQKAAAGSRGLLFVTGQPGIGKSFLINELRSAISKEKGYFISGKYDQYERGIPFNALIQALRGLIQQILTENSGQLARWKENILKALDTGGNVITRLLPELELIIGKQPEVSELGAIETRNRFLYVFQNFIKVFASSEHPLVLFLDDLQWIDDASLQLLKMVIIDNPLRSLLLIGAYRDNEVSVLHPLTALFDFMKSEKIEKQTIALGPLQFDHINQMAAEALSAPSFKTEDLTGLIIKKTGGNPFFTKQFLTDLYDKHLVRFYDAQQDNQMYDFEKILQADSTDNVVELMMKKLQQLPEDKCTVLKIASCIGLQFTVELVNSVYGKSTSQTINDLKGPVNSGLLIKEKNHYFFSHDRIQEAAYSLLDEKEKSRIHYIFGKQLLAGTGKDDLDKIIFELADHLNKAVALCVKEEEKNKLAWINLKAGIKAREATAFEAAKLYLKKALELIPPDAWKKDYDRILLLTLKTAEMCYLTGEIEHGDNYVDSVLIKAQSVLDKIRAYELKIVNATSHSPKDGVRYSKEAFKMLGIGLPPKLLYMPKLMIELLLGQNLPNKNIDILLQLPDITDPVILSMMHLVIRTGSCFNFSEPSALPLIQFNLIRIVFKYGNSPYSPFILMFDSIFKIFFNNFSKGYELGGLALKLQEKYGDQEFKSLFYYRFSTLINHWHAPFSEGMPYCMSAFKSGKKNGDFEYASYNLMWIAWANCFYKHISPEGIKSYINEMKTLHIKNSILWLNFTYDLIYSFTQEPEKGIPVQGELFDEEQSISEWITLDNKVFLASYYSAKLMQSYIFNLFDSAIDYALHIRPYLFVIILTREYTDFYFFYSLALLARCRQAGRKEKRNYMKEIKKNRRRLKKWGKKVPVNFAHSFFLIEAECKSLNSPFEKVIPIYDKAVGFAGKNGHVRDEAIANECAGRYCLSKKLTATAGVYLKEAYHLYKKWGAEGKVRQLEKVYPDLLIPFGQAEKISGDKISTSQSDSTTSANLDISTLMKAANTISSEIEMDILLSSILTILVENAGAGKGALLLTEENTFVIEAEFENEKAQAGLHRAVDGNGNISPGIIRYAANTKEPVVLDNAGEEGLFTGEAYIKDNNILSVLCLPIINQTRLVGLLYLENNLTTGVFSADRVETLKLLSTQAAISIDNARMYKSLEDLNKNLESKVEERTAELKQEKELKTRFFINLAHETKTPLTLITNYLDSYIKSQGVNQDLLIIKQNIDKLKKDMLNFLDSEKIELGKIEYDHNQVFNFSSYLNQKVRLFKETAGKLSIRLEETIEPGLFLKADPDSLDRIVNNLLDNALKFTKKKGRITVSLTVAEKNKLLLSVSDTGMGMSEKQKDDIFKPFVQISRKKERGQGIGMGLFIAKSIVSSLNGSIRVESEQGKGTVFFIVLPAYLPGANEQILDYQAEGTGLEVLVTEKELLEAVYDKEKKSVLIVEDNKNLLAYLQNNLVEQYNVFYALNGGQALTKLETIPAPDVILSDIMMEKMDGLEFLKTLSEKPEFNDIPFIFLTAKTTLEDKISGIKQGAVDYLFKPFSLEELKAKIKIHILNRQRYYDKLIKIVEEKIGESGVSHGPKVDFVSLFEQKAAEVNLTVREKEILLLLLNAKEYKEIAWELDLKLNTVRFHIKNIYKKFNMRSKGEIFALFKIS